MQTAMKAILCAAALGFAAFAVPSPADAAVSFSFGFGGPRRAYPPPYRPYYPPAYGYYPDAPYPPAYGYYPDAPYPPSAYPCYDPYAAPGYCGFPVFSGPLFFGGAWLNGPFPYRDDRGRREFWLRGGWHAVPFGRGGFRRR